MVTTGPGSAPTVGVLALQGNVREHLAALGAAGAHAVPVRRPQELAAVEGLVLPGGESTTIDKLLRIFGLREPVRARIAAGMPVFGSCAGMILLADHLVDAAAGQETLGGMDITVRRNAFGRQADSFEDDLRVQAIAEAQRPFHAVFIRAPWVESSGPTVEVLATEQSGDGRSRPVAVRQGHLLATAFHPELTSDARLHALFWSMVVEARTRRAAS